MVLTRPGFNTAALAPMVAGTSDCVENEGWPRREALVEGVGAQESHITMSKALLIRLCCIVSMLIVGGGAMASASPASAALQKFVYQVRHSTYGSIGTYTNSVETNGDKTTVTTEGRIRVSILGIVLYRQDFDRVERWVGERLMSFEGLTTTNGRATEVKGKAEGDSFAVSSPNGTFMAPATVKLANPWSDTLLKGETMMTPDRGQIEDVKIRPAEMTELAINGSKVRARRYEIARITGEKRYDVWIDDGGTPVMFNVNTRRGMVTFTLTS
jgi:hypothetical protein